MTSSMCRDDQKDDIGGIRLKISKFTTQKKNTDRLNVFVQRGEKEEFAFAVDVDVFIKYGLKKGMELDEEFVEQVLVAEDRQKAYRMALNYLSHRMRATSEVIRYLKEKETDPTVVTYVIERLQDQKYVNDAEFAKAFAQTKFNTTLSGPLKIKRELEQLNVAPKWIEEAIRPLDEEQQLEKAGRYVQKKQSETKTRSATEVKQRIQQSLVQRGFAFDIIAKAIQLFWENTDDDVEVDACLRQAEKLWRKVAKYDEFERKQRVKTQLRRKGFSFDVIDRALEQLEDVQT